MYQWYENAGICLAYLADVSSEPIHSESASVQGEDAAEHTSKPLEPKDTVSGRLEDRLRRCEWFTRGWTLQELIAPPEVVMVSKNWEPLGTRTEHASLITEITNIDQEALLHQVPVAGFSVAAKMSWMSKRTTSKIEDEAYCLLGLFDINMPLLYGEGKRAFKRLQEEIVRTGDDESIFAWERKSDNSPSPSEASPNVFATNASLYASNHRVMKVAYHSRPPYFVTNKGLQIQAVLWPHVEGTYLVHLNCAIRNSKGYGDQLALKVQRLPGHRNRFRRLGCIAVQNFSSRCMPDLEDARQKRTVFLQTNGLEKRDPLNEKFEALWIERDLQNKGKKVDKLLKYIYDRCVDWTKFEPSDLHILCISPEGYVKAKAVLVRALQEYEQSWGKEHAKTLGMAFKIASFCAAEGATEEAKELYERILRGLRETGDRNPWIVRAVSRRLQTLPTLKQRRGSKEYHFLQSQSSEYLDEISSTGFQPGL